VKLRHRARLATPHLARVELRHRARLTAAHLTGVELRLRARRAAANLAGVKLRQRARFAAAHLAGVKLRQRARLAAVQRHAMIDWACAFQSMPHHLPCAVQLGLLLLRRPLGRPGRHEFVALVTLLAERIDLTLQPQRNVFRIQSPRLELLDLLRLFADQVPQLGSGLPAIAGRRGVVQPGDRAWLLVQFRRRAHIGVDPWHGAHSVEPRNRADLLPLRRAVQLRHSANLPAVQLRGGADVV